jgi:hypothetical protein
MTMRETMIVCLLLSQSFTVTGCHLAALQAQQPYTPQPAASSRKVSREWHPANYFGLTMGKSTRSEMMSILGKPDWTEAFDQDRSKAGGEVWYHYNVAWELPGTITVVVDKSTDIIRAIDLSPNDLSKVEAIKYFGNDYIVTRYDADSCLGDEESAPLYESSNGVAMYIEYRERGIAIAVAANDEVRYIFYVSEPIGAPSSKCKR